MKEQLERSTAAALLPALSARDIIFGWDEASVIFNGLCLDAARGQTLAILGPNGAGKTTLLSILAGRLTPRAGSVSLEDRPLNALSARERARHIAFLPQLEKLPFNYRVLDFVLMGRMPHMESFSMPKPEDEARARESLAMLEMESFMARNIGELSGGELQLVRIARCLAQGASILMLDEPASMLDPAHSRRIADALVSLAIAGKTIIYTTHDIGLGIFLGGRAIIIARGSVVWDGYASGLNDVEMLEKAYGISFSIKELPSAF